MRFHKILVPTDFSDAARAAVPYARELARLHGAEVLLAHVMELPQYPTLFEGTALVVPPMDDNLRRQLEHQLGEAARAWFADHGVSARTLLREGPPTQMLLDIAKDEGCDLIVVATHGYTGLKHMLLGSTTEQIVRHACCPVLTVRADLEAPRGG